MEAWLLFMAWCDSVGKGGQHDSNYLSHNTIYLVCNHICFDDPLTI